MEIYNRTDEQIFDYWTQLQEMWMSLYSCELPIICQINGTCPAAGCLMACSADYRIMESNPKFKIGLNETQLGFAAPDWLCWVYQGKCFIDSCGSLYDYCSCSLCIILIVDVIGKRQGELHLELGSLFSPKEALKLGLVDAITDSNILDLEAEKMALKFIKVPKKALTTTKQLLRKPKIKYLIDNRERDTLRFIAQVQAPQTQKDIGNYINAMKKK